MTVEGSPRPGPLNNCDLVKVASDRAASLGMDDEDAVYLLSLPIFHNQDLEIKTGLSIKNSFR